MPLPNLSRLSARAAAALLSATRSLLGYLRRTARGRRGRELAREVLAHWLSERRTIRQGFVALALCIGVTLFAGVILGGIDALLERLPGLLVLVPPAIGMRGAIFGALGARLGTGMLTGQFTSGLQRRSFTGENLEAAALLSLFTAGLVPLLAWVVANAAGSATIGPLQFVIISVTGAVLSSIVVGAVVLALARTTERRSWDMDAIGTPIISATADLSTIPALVVGSLLVGHGTVDTVLGGLALAVTLAAGVAGLRNGGAMVRRIVRESVPVLCYAATMGVLAGTVLQARQATLSPALLVAVPPFIASCGAIGGVLSARLSSFLHLGLTAPQPLPDRVAGLEGTLTVLFGVVAFATVGLLTQVATLLVGFDSPGALSLAASTLSGGLLAVGILFVVGYYAATASYRFGLDPDNVSIPIVTSTMDFLGILCLVAGIAAF